jgi:dienelactone hydrolase
VISSIGLLASLVFPGDTLREIAIVVPGPVPLHGVLTLPARSGESFPGVVIVHGSGGGDRDGTLGPNKPYRDLAAGLAARGIAVLRYDKRAGVKPLWYLNRAFTVREETIDDAVSALAVLRNHPEVDPSRTFVVGHSLGGQLAPRIAEADGHLAGMILMAGAWITPLPELMVEQMDYMLTIASREDSARLAAQRRVIQHNVDRIAALSPADSGNLSLMLGAPAAYWLDLRQSDPVASLRARPEPVLILQGERDYQVTPAMLDDFLASLGERPATTVVRYTTLNHLFIAGVGVPRPGEYSDAGSVASSVVDDIARWVHQRR